MADTTQVADATPVADTIRIINLHRACNDLYINGVGYQFNPTCECLACQRWCIAIPGLRRLVKHLRATYNRTVRLAAETAAREKMARVMAAEARAKALFLSLLTEQQQAEYQALESVNFVGQSGRLYNIRHGFSGNVSGYRSYCCYLKATVPTFDHMIGQLLALKYNEEHFLNTAY